MSSPLLIRLALAASLLGSWSPPGFAAVSVAPASGSAVVDGEAPHLVITGLRPGARATVHMFRQATVYSYVDPPATVIAHAEATFVADEDGKVKADTASSVAGTYIGADPLGLLWSGVRMPPAGEPDQAVTHNLKLADAGDLLLRVETPSIDEHWTELRLRLTDGRDEVVFKDVSSPGLNGAFARPRSVASGKPLPAILLLHGSEGGSAEAARSSAVRFARLGYAAFAVNYFAWPSASVNGMPQALVDVPVETVAAVRDWLKRQPNVSAEAVAVWGVSKGAEFALVAASQYPWIDRVIACVPSSVVWSGFGRPPVAGEVYSSWSVRGTGLPYIPYDDFSDVAKLRWSSAFVHQRSFNGATEEQRNAARIPVERSQAKILLLAAEKDVVWPSANMTRQIEASLREAGVKDRERSIVFPNASHYICGTGSEPRRAAPVHRPEGDDPSPEADAHAAADGWAATKAFLLQD